ncbi:hypothetical protein GCM10023321_41180 [Pseudonocardia eucalypti]|uniref:Cupin type-2 domain-containing protein n=1 Tax=Pseudonocardia eucalypti TaxID=648755 RepID=A0ABP9QCP8_9PSEU
MTVEWHHAPLHTLAGFRAPQRQVLTPAIAKGAQVSSGFVVMPAGHAAAAHVHDMHDMIVIVLEGNVTTLIGERLENEYRHEPGDSFLIPAGQPHVGINAAPWRCVLVECRSDPYFNEDVTLLPELEAVVQRRAAELRADFAPPEDRRTILDRV